MLKVFGQAAALLLGMTGLATADVVFTFAQVGPTVRQPIGGNGPGTPIAVTTTASLVVSDEAYANGFSFSVFNPVSPQTDGLKGLFLSTTGLPEEITFNLQNFLEIPPIPRPFNRRLNLMSGPGGLPQGELYYNLKEEADIRLTFGGGSIVTGHIGSDYGLCFHGCLFQGVMTVTSVPEPATLGLLGLGLAGLGAARLRGRDGTRKGRSEAP